MTGLQRWTFRLAVTLVVVTLALPVMMGSLTTTLGAGMAFLDWPTSDGQNMLFYDIFHDIRVGNIDKVAEHGHRLAGMLVGILSIPLAIVGWFDGRRGVRWLTLGILLGVIVQGLLGGFRVRLDARILAMIHSIFAALLVVLMGLTMMVTSRRWSHWSDRVKRPGMFLVGLSCFLPLLVVVQYIAGGLVRHFGMAIPEHLAGAAVIGILTVACAMGSLQSGLREVVPLAWSLFAAVALQLLLGIGAWAGKFGLAAFGVVAVQRGVLQVTVRTLHTAGGMLLLMVAAMLAVALVRARVLSRRHGQAAFGADSVIGRTDAKQEHAASPDISGGQLVGGVG